MLIEELVLFQYKSHSQAKFSFSQKVVFFLGNNGSGKSNILDAIYLLAYTKSYFSSSDAYCVQHETKACQISAKIELEDRQDQVVCTIEKGKKKTIKINGKTYGKLSEHIGRFPLVIISPHDQDLINDSAETRRRFFDSLLSNFDPIYLSYLIDYQQLLIQRNVYLKQLQQTQKESSLLNTYDARLEKMANYIYETRKKFVAAFVPLVQSVYNQLGTEKTQMDIVYQSSMHKASLSELLSQSRENDLRLGYTTVGIHRDDFEFLRDGYSLRQYGSQGQKKIAIISLKLAQSLYTSQQKNTKPFVLLDDIFDKLDSHRVDALVQMVNTGDFGQIFITDTQKERFEYLQSKLKDEVQLVELT